MHIKNSNDISELQKREEINRKIDKIHMIKEIPIYVFCILASATLLFLAYSICKVLGII